MSRLDGIGRGVAIPHALLGTISSPVVSLTRLAQPVDFDGPYDNQSISFRASDVQFESRGIPVRRGS
ncbi:PTS sugar transporter subunit IIA [Mesorhizobium sp. M0408]|uniref:PTS sugar transporter subunit IIA n=1 Tax=Mesorhizobium sp. M0408 TaxID=2956942 RepID=UPI0033365F7E